MNSKYLALAVIITGGILTAQAGPASAQDGCAPDGDLHFICGVQGAEDILPMEGTSWLIASGLGTQGAGGGIHLINGAEKSVEKIYPLPSPPATRDDNRFADCPGAPDSASFTAHGLSLRDDELLAINHAREAVEYFSVAMEGGKPALTWIGCVIMPDGTYTNSVAALEGGGFVATKMFDPTKENAFADIFAGKVTGLVYEWSPDTGFSVVPGSTLSGPNGIEVSADGKWVYVAAFGSKELVRLSRDGSSPEREAIAVEFTADNLRWTDNNTLLVAGAMPPGTDGGWRVAAWDVETMTTETVLSYPASSPISGVSVAVEALNHLWIGSFNANRIGYIAVE